MFRKKRSLLQIKINDQHFPFNKKNKTQPRRKKLQHQSNFIRKFQRAKFSASWSILHANQTLLSLVHDYPVRKRKFLGYLCSFWNIIQILCRLIYEEWMRESTFRSTLLTAHFKYQSWSSIYEYCNKFIIASL